MQIKGGRAGSISALKKVLKRGSGTQYLTRIPAEGMVVRFAEEPTAWFNYHEHYDKNDTDSYYKPCLGDGCPKDDDPDKDVRKTSKRVLTNAIDVTEGKLVPLVLPVSVANALLKKYDKYKTLLDRDYEITKEGSGMDTEYDVTPEAPTKMNISRFGELFDPEELLINQWAGSADDDDDEEDDEDSDDSAGSAYGMRRRPAKKVARPGIKKKPVKKPIERSARRGVIQKSAKKSVKKPIKRTVAKKSLSRRPGRDRYQDDPPF